MAKTAVMRLREQLSAIERQPETDRQSQGASIMDQNVMHPPACTPPYTPVHLPYTAVHRVKAGQSVQTCRTPCKSLPNGHLNLPYTPWWTGTLPSVHRGTLVLLAHLR